MKLLPQQVNDAVAIADTAAIWQANLEDQIDYIRGLPGLLDSFYSSNTDILFTSSLIQSSACCLPCYTTQLRLLLQ